MPTDPCRQRSLHRPVTRVVGPLVLCAVTVVMLTGCALGKRPTLVEQPTLDDDEATAVIDLFKLAPSLTFSATYNITPALTGETTQATVVQSGVRQRVTIGDVEYFSDGTTSRTCVAGTNECANGIDDARVSNLSITHAFWSESTAQRLAIDASRTIAPSSGRSDTIAGQPATCVDLKMAAAEGQVGTVIYCAIDPGVLGRYSGADVGIELTSFAPTADEAQLSG